MQEALDAVFLQNSVTEELTQYPRTVGTRQDVLVHGRASFGDKDLVGTFETAVAPGEQGAYHVTLTRRWEWDGQGYSTVWRFQVRADGTVVDLGRTDDNLPEF